MGEAPLDGTGYWDAVQRTGRLPAGGLLDGGVPTMGQAAAPAMSWTTVVWAMEAAVCLTLAVIYLLVWCRRREEMVHLLFAVSAAASASGWIGCA